MTMLSWKILLVSTPLYGVKLAVCKSLNQNNILFLNHFEAVLTIKQLKTILPLSFQIKTFQTNRTALSRIITLRSRYNIFRLSFIEIVNKISNKNTALSDKAGDPSNDGNEETDNDDSAFSNLPYYCKLIILSHLGTGDICRLSMCNRHWRDICADKFLWRELLCRDALVWESICSRSYPLLGDAEMLRLNGVDNSDGESSDHLTVCTTSFHERLCCRGPIDYKGLYILSAYQRFTNRQQIGLKPEKNDQTAEERPQPPAVAFGSFPRFIRNMWVSLRSGGGQVVMLGPGMESNNTSVIFKSLMWARPDLFEVKRLLAGGQDGVGSGVELEFKGEKRFKLVALYSGNKKERGERGAVERLRRSKILERIPALDGEEMRVNEKFVRVPRQFRLADSVIKFLRSDANAQQRQVIYVVDATGVGQTAFDISYNRLELQAFVDGMRLCECEPLEGSSEQPGVRTPLLVICCHTTHAGGSERISSCEVAAYLDLSTITDRRWFVQQVNVDDLSGLETGLTWLFQQS